MKLSTHFPWIDFHQNWAFLALVIIVMTLVIRYILVSDSFRAVKSLGKESYRQVIHQYAAQSVAGWLYIALASVSAEILLVFPERFPFWLTREEGVLISAIFFLVGVFLHIRAIHFATVSVVKENAELDRTF